MNNIDDLIPNSEVIEPEVVEDSSEPSTLPKWVENHYKWQREYGKSRTKCIGIRLRTQEDSEYIKIFNSIPGKTDWLRRALKAWKRGDFK